MIKIYSLNDPDTLEIRYIGKTELSLEDRLNYHIYESKKYSKTHKNRWILKLIKNNKKPIINLIKSISDKRWKYWEKFYIKKFRNEGYNLTNFLDGGNGFSSNDVEKLWKLNSYRIKNTKRMIGKNNPFYGKHHTEKTKDILRKKCPHYGKDNPNYGKKRDKKTVEKGRLNQPNLKIILRFDKNGNFIDKWIGIKEMCRKLNLDDSAVIRVAKGKNTHHKGFIFKYE